MSRSPTMPALCCDGCLPDHREAWEVRPNPYSGSGRVDLPCAFCGSPDPRSMLTVACPIGAGAKFV